MNRWSVRVWLGAGLIVLGLLMLLEQFKLVPGATNIYWGLVMLAIGGWFLYRFATNMHREWWTAIPGFALLGIAAESLLSGVFPNWSGFFFVGALGLGFFAVYVSERERWWAIIPGGVLVTIGLASVLGDALSGPETGGLYLLGFGLTFLLLAIVASAQWAWIPGVVLLVIGAFIGMPLAGGVNYIWPAALILGGLLLIFQFVRRAR